MKAHARLIAALFLALAPAALAHAQPRGRGEGRGAEGRREEPRREEGRREGPMPRYEEPRGPQSRGPESRRERDYRGPYGPAPAPPAYRPYGGYGQPGPVYGPPPPRYAPPQGYVPNSLGDGWSQQQDQARRGVRQGGLMPLHSVMSMIGNRTPGRLLDAGIEPGPEGRPAYRVRWAAKGGRRIDFIVDAATGAIISRSGG
jgi:hypothetical protein